MIINCTSPVCSVNVFEKLLHFSIFVFFPFLLGFDLSIGYQWIPYATQNIGCCLCGQHEWHHNWWRYLTNDSTNSTSYTFLIMLNCSHFNDILCSITHTLWKNKTQKNVWKINSWKIIKIEWKFRKMLNWIRLKQKWVWKEKKQSNYIFDYMISICDTLSNILWSMQFAFPTSSAFGHPNWWTRWNHVIRSFSRYLCNKWEPKKKLAMTIQRVTNKKFQLLVINISILLSILVQPMQYAMWNFAHPIVCHVQYVHHVDIVHMVNGTDQLHLGL